MPLNINSLINLPKYIVHCSWTLHSKVKQTKNKSTEILPPLLLTPLYTVHAHAMQEYSYTVRRTVHSGTVVQRNCIILFITQVPNIWISLLNICLSFHLQLIIFLSVPRVTYTDSFVIVYRWWRCFSFSTDGEDICHSLQVVKMFVIVIVIFGICWLPYHVYFIYSFHDQSIVR